MDLDLAQMIYGLAPTLVAGGAARAVWAVLAHQDQMRVRLAQIGQAHRELQAMDRPTAPPRPPLAAPFIEGEIVPPRAPSVDAGRRLAAPPMRELLAQGIIRAGGPLVTDYRDGQPTYGATAQIFTAGDAGRAGSGKTRTAGFLLGQRVLQGAVLLGVDPHSFKPDSLTRLLAPLPAACWLAPMATTRPDMETVIARAEAELEARRNGGPLFDLVLVIDEYTSFMREDTPLARRMARVVEAVATEGRGMAFNGLIIGQNWKGTRAGGTEVREMLQSSYVHRSWARQARYLVPDNDTADLAETLTPGQAIFCPADDDPVQVAIPYCDSADLGTIARMLPPPVSARFRPVSGTPAPVSGPVSPLDVLWGAETAPETGSVDPAKRAAFLVGLADRRGIADLGQEIWGAKPGAGAAWKAAQEDIKQILADLVREG